MSEAQRLANHIHCGDDLCKCSRNNAAAELRRLDAREAEWKTLLRQALEALEAMQSYAAAERGGLRICDEAILDIRAAIKAATGEKT